MKAIYKKEGVHYSHWGNPLIEALPTPLSETEYAGQITRLPRIDMNAAMASDPHSRMHDVRQIGSLYVPNVQSIEMGTTLDVEIFHWLNRRQPFSAETQMYLDQVQDQFREDEKQFGRGQGALHDAFWAEEASGSAICVTGPSGSGKTSSIRRLLTRYPSLIEHVEYNGRAFRQKQVVWISIDAPVNGAISVLCDELLRQFDDALGFNGKDGYAEKYRRKPIGSSMSAIVQIAATHFLGLLHVDDIHRCAPGNGDGAKLIEFLIAFANRVRVPLLLSGTSKMVKVLGKSFEAARRAGSCYEFRLPKDEDDVDFITLLIALFEYQLLVERVEISEHPDLIKKIFFLTRGIPGVVVSLYRYAHEAALRSDHTKLSVEHFDAGYQRLKLLHTPLEILRRGNAESLRRYEDLMEAEDLIQSMAVKPASYA